MKIIKEVRSRGISLSKHKGQCLLVNNKVMDRIVKAAVLDKDDLVIDIGTGPGHLVERIAPYCGYYVGVEIDKKCYDLALKKTARLKNIFLINSDILKKKDALNPEVVEKIRGAIELVKPARVKVVSNLPYHIATPVIIRLLLQNEIPIDLMLVMVQREAAYKIGSHYGQKNYSHVSVIAGIACRSRIAFLVKKDSFFPRPMVESAVMEITPFGKDNRLVPDKDLRGFELFAKRVFNFRKKNIINSIMHSHVSTLDRSSIGELLLEIGIQPDRHILQCPVEDFIKLYHMLIKD